MTDIVVLGSLNMDLVVRAPRIPQPGETIHGEDFDTIPGGKGANQAAAAARLGANVKMVGRVGADDFGPILLENMRVQGVDVSHIRVDPDTASGISLITIDAAGENSIVLASGANARVSLEDVGGIRGLLAQARFLVMQFEIPLPIVGAAIALAKDRGVQVILNPAPAYPVDAEFLQGVTYLVVNETEAQTLTGLVVHDVESARAAGRALLETGVPVVIVTLGGEGALVATPDGTAHVPAHRVQVVDTTAAGDAFVGGLATALLAGLELVEAVRYATCAGTLATTVLGAQTSLPSANQVQALYEEGQL